MPSTHMRLRAGYEISIRCPRPTPLLAFLSLHPSRAPDVHADALVVTDRDCSLTTFVDPLGNVCTRALAPAGVLTFRTDFLIDDAGLPDASAEGARQVPIEELPEEVLPYLAASRYCESDKLSPVAWSLFGDVTPGAERVQAIERYVHARITFGYEHASSTRSAWEVHHGCRGVCRDFVHLAVAFCRAMNIPARYCSGYLGDIGVPPSDIPMDFTAWMEVYLDGRWYTFDPRHAARRIGRVLMARGRDAADVPLYTTFGPSELVRFRVHAHESERAIASRSPLEVGRHEA